VPIIFISTNVKYIEKLESLEKERSCFLPKPFSQDTLEKAILKFCIRNDIAA
jgi:two-component SAPR family response regulator